jgi:hypothetical protein
MLNVDTFSTSKKRKNFCPFVSIPSLKVVFMKCIMKLLCSSQTNNREDLISKEKKKDPPWATASWPL